MSGLLQFTIAVLFAAIVWSWRLLIIRWRAGATLVPFKPRRPVPWTGVDLLCIALVFLASNLIVSLMVNLAHEIAEHALRCAFGWPVVFLMVTLVHEMIDLSQVTTLLMGALASTAVVVAAALWIRLRHRATWTDLGLDSSRLRADLLLGLAAFAVVSVPIYAMQAGLTHLFPAEHPIITALRAADSGWALWLSSLVSAVLVAPLAEEFLFRVLFQGWLESLGRPKSPSRVDSPDRVDSPNSETDVAAQSATFNEEPEGRRRGRWMPVVISAAVFALMHLPRPDVVPLFFLALVLGYLYRQTHRLWPSMVAHGCLNACSLMLLWMGPPS